MTLTSEQAKEYMDNGCSACPGCGYPRMAINKPTFDKQKCIIQVDCYGCGQSFNEVYQISTIEAVSYQNNNSEGCAGWQP